MTILAAVDWRRISLSLRPPVISTRCGDDAPADAGDGVCASTHALNHAPASAISALNFSWPPWPCGRSLAQTVPWTVRVRARPRGGASAFGAAVRRSRGNRSSRAIERDRLGFGLVQHVALDAAHHVHLARLAV